MMFESGFLMKTLMSVFFSLTYLNDMDMNDDFSKEKPSFRRFCPVVFFLFDDVMQFSMFDQDTLFERQTFFSNSIIVSKILKNENLPDK